MTCLIGLAPAKSLGGAKSIRPSFCMVCCVKCAKAGPSGRGNMLMFPETIAPLYLPPCLFFYGLGGKATFGGLGVRPLLFTRMDDDSNPVPLPFPTKSLPSATATAEGYWPVGMKPRIFDFETSDIFSAVFPPRVFSERATTATALLW